jgi:hypothetical protein
MKENKCFLKIAVVGIIFLFIGISFLPSTIGNSNSSEDYNLKVYIKPSRLVFPRVYYGNGQPIGFNAGASNEGPESSPPFTLKFEIIKILSKETLGYNYTYDFPFQPNGQGMGTVFTWYTLIGWHFGIYEARATINVDDTNLGDNTISYYFIIIR